jgi:ERF superfamily
LEQAEAFEGAMSAVQGEMRAVATDSNNPQTRSKYASYYALDRALRPIYTRHGFSLSFDTADGAPDNFLRIVCYVGHRCGHSRTYHIDMPADGRGAKGGEVMTKTHATGSAVTYGQRYLLRMIFNIATGGDDDGNAAARRPPSGPPIADPPHDPNTGEIRQELPPPPAEPHQIPIDPLTPDWHGFATAFYRHVKRCTTNEATIDWEDKNNEQLAALWEADQQLHDKMMAAVNKHRDSLAVEATP